MRYHPSQRGFALATTVILMTVASVSLTTLIMVLGRSMRLTRSHTEAIRSFYTAEAGKAYAMWKLSPRNTDTDAGTLANCLAQNESCPLGLNVTWNKTIPSDTASSFSATASSSGQEPGEALLESYGQRHEGAQTARRLTKINAFKPIRQLEPNDQVLQYAVSTDEGFRVYATGYLNIAPGPDEPSAGIHSNTTSYVSDVSQLRVTGSINAASGLWLPLPPYQSNVQANQVRAASCGGFGCDSSYSNRPEFCFGTGCDGYVGNVPFPAIDINSSQPDSLKSVARTYETQYPGTQFFYTNSELEKLMDDAAKSGANGGFVDLPGPISYVNGSLTMYRNYKLRVHGLLVVQGNFKAGGSKGGQLCFYPTCTPSVELVVDNFSPTTNSNVVTGLVVHGQIDLINFLKRLDINGLIYSLGDFNICCMYEQPITTQGAIVARNYNNSNGWFDSDWPNVVLHQVVYETENLQLLIQGPRSVVDFPTVYTGHWEEEY